MEEEEKRKQEIEAQQQEMQKHLDACAQTVEEAQCVVAKVEGLVKPLLLKGSAKSSSEIVRAALRDIDACTPGAKEALEVASAKFAEFDSPADVHDEVKVWHQSHLEEIQANTRRIQGQFEKISTIAKSLHDEALR